jgi:autotransporter-associated beta strand protein
MATMDARHPLHPSRGPFGVMVIKLALALALALPILVATAAPSLAATRTWIGGGVNNFWSTPGNWAGGLTPNSGDIVVISAAATTTNTSNNFAGLTLAGLIVQRNFNLAGNSILIGANGIQVTAASSDIVLFSAQLRLVSNQTWKTGVAQVFVNGGVVLNGFALTFDVSNPALIDCNSTISGQGQLIKIGEGILRLDGDSTYMGPTRIDEGYVIVGHTNGLGFAGGTATNGTAVTTNANGSRAGTLQLDNVSIGDEEIDLAGPGQFGNSALQAKGTSSIGGVVVLESDIGVNVIAPAKLTFAGQIIGPGRMRLVHDGSFVFANPNNTFTGGVGIGEGGDPHTKAIVTANEGIPLSPVQNLPSGSTLSIDGAVTQTMAGLTGQGTARVTNLASRLILSGSGTYTLEGPLSGSGTVRHTGTGHQQLWGFLTTFDGQLIVDSGMVTVTTPTTTGDVTVNAGGTIVMSGTPGFELITLHDGAMRVRATGDNVPAVAAAQFEMTPASQLILETTASGKIGRVNVDALVGLGGTLTLPLAPAFSAPIGTVYTLIANAGADAVVGTFANLPQGATLTSGPARFQIAYNGGDGNDVTLTLLGIARDYLLSEGAIGAFFTTEIAIANPNGTAAPIRVSFLKSGGGTVDLNDDVPAMTRKTIVANDVAALDASEFSTVVRSLDGLPLVVERTMTWNREIGYGAHTERATDTPSTTWYFAEGSQGFFSTFLLLANPQTSPLTATVDYLLEGAPKVTRTYDVPALSRRTVDAASDAALVNQSFGMVVTFSQPGLAERAMYFGTDPLWRGGHASAGVSAPSTTAFVAEGATGPFFETFILIANPQPDEVDVALTFLRQGEAPIAMSRTIPAASRLTLNIETLDPGLANAAVATSITATAPVIVERAQYWPDPAPQWYEAHGSPALQAAGTKWGLAEGRVGGASNHQTYILLANTNASAEAHVSITFLRESGAPFTKTFTVPASQRFNVRTGPGTDVPELVDERFGALITSDQPIVVERAMYSDAGGQTWAAGTSANATRLP